MADRRIPIEFLGAFKAGHRPAARDFIDEEFSQQLLNKIINSNYQDKESIEALAFIAKFNNEFHKNVIKKGDTKALHHTDCLRKKCYDQENSRNRDVMSVEKDRVLSIDQNTSFGDSSSAALDMYYNKNRNLEAQENALMEIIILRRILSRP